MAWPTVTRGAFRHPRPTNTPHPTVCHNTVIFSKLPLTAYAQSVLFNTTVAREGPIPTGHEVLKLSTPLL